MKKADDVDGVFWKIANARGLCYDRVGDNKGGKQVAALDITEQIDRRHEEDLQMLRDFRLIDDDFLTLD